MKKISEDKFVKAFRFGTWPNGEPKWLVGRWEDADNVVEYIYPTNFKSQKEASNWIKEIF